MWNDYLCFFDKYWVACLGIVFFDFGLLQAHTTNETARIIIDQWKINTPV